MPKKSSVRWRGRDHDLHENTDAITLKSQGHVMRQDRFKVGKTYFIGGYHDPQRLHPCVIKPVVYLGKKPGERRPSGEEDFEIYAFEELESWLARKGQGQPSPDKIEHIEGPSDMMLIMDLDQLIADLTRLRAKLGKR